MFLYATDIQSECYIIVKEVVSLHLGAILALYLSVINFRTFLSFFSGWGFSEHVRHLGFLLRTVLFYDAYAEAPV